MEQAAAELVRMKVDVIFASSSTEVEPARRATSTIPIVFAVHADPVGVGHVASLPRPGGNITGLSDLLTDLAPKQLETLKRGDPVGAADRRSLESVDAVARGRCAGGRGRRRKARAR